MMDTSDKAQLTEELLSQPPVVVIDEETQFQTPAPVPQSQVIPDSSNQSWEKGEVQPPACRDWPFALAFVGHLVGVAVVAFKYGYPVVASSFANDDPAVLQGEKEEDVKNGFHELLFLIVVSGLSALIITGASLSLMTKHAKTLVEASLFYSIGISFVLMVLFGLQQNLVGALFSGVGLLLGLCYARMVWRRIPFAASNLNTASTAIKQNYGVTFVPYLFGILLFAWTPIWALAIIGVLDVSCDENGVCEGNEASGLSAFLLSLSYFWTQQVVQNVIHVTVAGVVGTWWFDPQESNSFCSRSIWDALRRSLTTSFGSICFGSLLVAILQALRELVHNVRQSRDTNAILLCILECLINMIERFLRYFNKWAYIYVGLYGYSYIEAGTKVTKLFLDRGWSTIITDNLVSNTLGLMSLASGLATGCVGYIVSVVMNSWFHVFGDSAGFVSFLVAFIIGVVISSILMGVVDSSVNTVIVSFAEAPQYLQTNHPAHYTEMTESWLKVYPDDCAF
mmetsp:Transcript_16517/g.25221  ORF Transcript_16517/g.25221 Transcript_16517/m.25221 type:complete len:509 (+) Transcript_16517:116-1642(+)